MYTVLMPVDGDDTAHAETIEFISRLSDNQELTVFVVHARADIDIIGSDGGRVDIDHEDLAVPATLDEAVTALQSRGVATEGVALEGEPVNAIVDFIKEAGVDQVFVPTKARSPVGKFVFGSTTLDLIRESPVPVTVVTQRMTGS